MKEIYDYKKIEKEVQDLWARNKRYEASIDTTKPKYYCLSMLPYPSGNPNASQPIGCRTLNPLSFLYLETASPIE